MKLINLTGQQFGRLTVGRYLGNRKWECVCCCGTTKAIHGLGIRSGKATSCGCRQREASRENGLKCIHGMYKTTEYHSWSGMRSRCNNPKDKSFKRYGGRGIRICEEWNTFSNFYADMGSRPAAGMSIDRIDPDGMYCKANCRWATAKQQQRNRSKKRLRELNGEKKLLTEWCEQYGIRYGTAQSRLKRGWTLAEAMGL